MVESSDEFETSEFVVEPGRSEVQAEARDLNPDDVLTRSKKVQLKAERTKLDASEKEVLRELEELTGAQERENEKKRKRVDAYKAEIRRLKKLKTDSN
ncbi:hypothetical protein EUX98_g936 [Antrodiella citrinella]|uniref:Uncharacterized protein n=1 Tax=Antrodiella citrinella TaxID=2447956 RepID=A0A4S4N565_9APHY|nr:hypothetical protein EUX98_g936 [Antrodiella citrinella]